ncbi:MAG: RdgB/HAM1 family non-canonical purine NTP pyrophosphatase [Planctomycetota bacterium]|nr:MAG: RdgB/HAM1 family non-canonical purine NTP pyrophosphatase [Planctomycetota bacterium]
MREILLATNNPGKAKEMFEILSSSASPLSTLIWWRFLSDFPTWPQPIEDGDTFEANAVLKAHHYARLSGLWTIADDSGLEVDALDGEPGVRSSRYAGDSADTVANNTLLVKRLAGVPAERRTARFRCVCVLSDGDNILARARGTIEGRIIDEPRGSKGFGYDPHFWVEQSGLTAAEMSPEQKHAISHRGQALRRLKDKLLELLRPEAVE